MVGLGLSTSPVYTMFISASGITIMSAVTGLGEMVKVLAILPEKLPDAVTVTVGAVAAVDSAAFWLFA